MPMLFRVSASAAIAVLAGCAVNDIHYVGECDLREWTAGPVSVWKRQVCRLPPPYRPDYFDEHQTDINRAVLDVWNTVRRENSGAQGSNELLNEEP